MGGRGRWSGEELKRDNNKREMFSDSSWESFTLISDDTDYAHESSGYNLSYTVLVF